uniref:SLAM family member 9 n=1 Tax=Xenopus tropicalis TaxID=8364 RepID=A0A803JSP2_XENTR
MKPIELVFFLSLVLQICSVTGNGPVPVIDHVEGSVVLPYSLSVPVREAYWDFPCNGHRVKVAEFRDQKFSITREEFRSRMDCSDNGTSLMIRNLRMNDSGIYTALIYDTEQRRHEISYNLTVFKLVPKPDIKKRNEDGQCNYTLHCSIQSDSSALSYSWMYRYNNFEYQHYANGSTIQISAQKNTWEFLCLVENPVHKNNETFTVPTCHGIQTVNAENKRLRVLLIGATVPVLLAVVIAVFLITRIQIKMADIIYKEIQVFPKKSTNQENGTDSKGLLYQETTYVDVKR